ncbi:MAG TPA: hypothetical protein VM734_20225 [Kofleriaceae bacterium]|nr:hypothetical protein [Kofleriaceae bacterium]
MKRCSLLADSLISGEPLSDGDRAHLADCADCARLAAVPALVAATAIAPEPGPGFAARVTAGARERMASHRRQRVIAASLATMTAAVAAVVITQRDTPAARPQQLTTAPAATIDAAPAAINPSDPTTAADDEVSDDELRALVRNASLSHAMAPTANWDDIEAPLRNYRAVLARGGTP